VVTEIGQLDPGGRLRRQVWNRGSVLSRQWREVGGTNEKKGGKSAATRFGAMEEMAPHLGALS